MDPLLEATEIVTHAERRASLNPLLVARFHLRRPSSLPDLRRRWALMPDADKEQLLLLCAQLTGLVLAALLERWGGRGNT